MQAARISRIGPIRKRNFASSAALRALNATARSKAEQISSEWQGTSATGGNTKNYIDGKFVDSNTTEWHDVVDPVCEAQPEIEHGV